MKKCIVISDSFKGSLSSGEICEIARESFQNVFPACKLVCIPAVSYTHLTLPTILAV